MKRICFKTANSIGHMEVPDDYELNEEEMKQEPYVEPLLPAEFNVNKVFGGANDTFDEVRNAVAQALLEHSAAFPHVYFELQDVTKDGFFFYNHTAQDGKTTTFKARWYLLGGVITLDFTGQTTIQSNRGGNDIEPLPPGGITFK